LLGYWLDLLFASGIEHILANTHYLAPQVEQFVDSSRWRASVTLVPEPELLGTGGTVLANRAQLDESAFLLAHADNLCRFDVRAFIDAHASRAPGVEITMMTFRTDAPERCGIVECDERGVVVGFHEKVANPPGFLANAAVYILEPSIFSFLSRIGRPVIDFSTEVIPSFMGRIGTWDNTDYLRDIGTLDSLARANEEFQA
jgi:mannose-1-phosphate guanylyltransferase